MSDDRYGNTRVAKIRAAYNDLRSALAEGDMGAAQAAFARYEQWSDYILDKRHSDRISALEARVKALTAAEALVAECDIYLKEGETPRQRMDRDHLDILALGKMLADDRKRRDEAEARVKALSEALEFYADESTYVTHYEREACDCCTRIFEPINEDRGETAREALQENTDETNP